MKPKVIHGLRGRSTGKHGEGWVKPLVLGVVLALLAALPAAQVGSSENARMLQVVPPIPLPPPPVKVMDFTYSIENETLHLTVVIMLPNPCYQATSQTAVLEEGRILLKAVITPPRPGTVCIQVVSPTTLTYAMPLPPPGDYPTFLQIYTGASNLPLPVGFREIYLGTVRVPASQALGLEAVEATRYQGLLTRLVGEWSEVPGYWLYEARIEGLGKAVVAIPLEITGGLPAGFAGRGHEEPYDNTTLVVLHQVTISK